MGYNFMYAEQVMAGEDLKTTLDYLTREVSQISVAIVKIAEQEQKMVSLLQRQDRVDRDMETLTAIVTGPEGILVKVERTSARVAGICVVASGGSAGIVSVLISVFGA